MIVSRSGFYKKLNSTLSKTKVERKIILDKITTIRKNSKKKAYGAPRLKVELFEEYGLNVSVRRITEIMKENDIKVSSTKKFKASKSSEIIKNIKPNLLNQNFKVEYKNQVWVTDITYIWTKEGWLYLSSILDLWSKKIIAYEVRETMDKSLVIDTLSKSYLRESTLNQTIVHSDQGSQYTSNDYCDLVNKLGLIQSMSRRGNCYDNAVIESFHSTIKKEMVYLEGTISKKEMKLKIFDYIEGFYNKERRHSSIEYMSPENFEKKYKKFEKNVSTILT